MMDGGWMGVGVSRFESQDELDTYTSKIVHISDRRTSEVSGLNRIAVKYLSPLSTQ